MKLSKNKRNKLYQEINSYSQFGLIGETAILSEFIRFGLQCYLPYGDLERCDMVVSFNGVLKKIQIKSVYGLVNGSIKADITSKNDHQRYKYNSSDVDYFAIYSYDLGQCFLVPIEEVENMATITLRIDPPLNNNSINIRWAKDYHLSKMINKILTSMDK